MALSKQAFSMRDLPDPVFLEVMAERPDVRLEDLGGYREGDARSVIEAVSTIINPEVRPALA